jgi:antitoxin VapB
MVAVRLPGRKEIILMSELDVKLTKIRKLLRAQALDALLLRRVENFAWATCGAASYVDIAVSNGASSLLITASGRYIITDNIEAPRLMQEEGLEAQGWEFRLAPWFEMNQAIAELTHGLKLGADGPYPGAADISSAFSRLRRELIPAEVKRFRGLGKMCAAAMDATIRSIRPGMTEYEISALLAAEAVRRGVMPIVDLVAADERVFRFHHPLPTDNRMERYAMLVLCGRKWGLVGSLTRLIHFGPLPEHLRAKAAAVAQVDARCHKTGTKAWRDLSSGCGCLCHGRFSG